MPTEYIALEQKDEQKKIISVQLVLVLYSKYFMKKIRNEKDI